MIAGGGETQQRNVRVNRTTFNGKKGKGFYNYLFRSIRKRLWCQSCSIVGSSSFVPQTIIKWFRFAETLKPCCEYQSCKACSVKRHVAFIALCAVAFLYCKNKAMIQENMAEVFFCGWVIPWNRLAFFFSVGCAMSNKVWILGLIVWQNSPWKCLKYICVVCGCSDLWPQKSMIQRIRQTSSECNTFTPSLISLSLSRCGLFYLFIF